MFAFVAVTDIVDPPPPLAPGLYILEKYLICNIFAMDEKFVLIEFININN